MLLVSKNIGPAGRERHVFLCSNREGGYHLYETGDFIIYGNEGVCKVEAVGIPDIPIMGKKRLYYTLLPQYQDGKIFAPVDTKTFMRHVITKEKAEELIEEIPTVKAEIYENTNMRFLSEHYQSFFESHKCRDLLKLVRDVYLKESDARERGKKLGQVDEKYMRRAEELLHGELSVALGIPKEEVKDYITKSVEGKN